MIRYWVQFKLPLPSQYPMGLARGCGVTAYDKDDAMELIRKSLFTGDDIPEVSRITENVDISTLDANHVLPNMASPLVRGIWFPARAR
jgi:hypothetical protein